MQAATLAQIATQNVAWATVEINALEATTGGLEAGKLASLYDLRLKEILAAMRHGVSADELAGITGNGA